MLSTQAHESPTALAALASAFTGLATALILFTVLPSAAIGGEVVFTVASSAAIEAKAGRSHDPKTETGELVSQAIVTLKDSSLSLGEKRQKLRALVATGLTSPTWRIPPSGTIGVSCRRSSVSSS